MRTRKQTNKTTSRRREKSTVQNAAQQKNAVRTETIPLGPIPLGQMQVTHCCSVAQSCPTLWPHRLQLARLPYPSPSPRAWSNSCPSNQWCHPTISSSVIPFSSCLQSFPASGSFLMSCPFTAGDQIIGASASVSVLPVNIQDWFPLGLTGLISLLSKGQVQVTHAIDKIYCNDEKGLY